MSLQCPRVPKLHAILQSVQESAGLPDGYRYKSTGISRGAGPGVAAAAAGGAPLPVPWAAPAGAAAYLADNQIAPFLWFAHLTTNQAILDAAELAADPATGLELDLYSRRLPSTACSCTSSAAAACSSAAVELGGAGCRYSGGEARGDEGHEGKG